jgi:non-ribosomal peptide synthetase component E (peptide arylation enzyme)
MSENLAGRLIATVERYPDATALKLGDATLTYAGLDDMTSRLAAFLAERGIEAGDRVGIMLPNVPEIRGRSPSGSSLRGHEVHGGLSRRVW